MKSDSIVDFKRLNCSCIVGLFELLVLLIVFEEFLLVCLSDTRGRTGFENKEYPQIDYLKALYQAALAVDVQQVIADGFEKQGIRDELTRRRIAAVKAEKTRLNA